MSETALVHLTRARQEIQTAKTFEDVQNGLGRAEQLRLLARQMDASVEVKNEVTELLLRWKRRAGEMLKEGAEKGERRKRGGNQKSKSHNATLIEPPTLEEIGVDKTNASRWQALASIPEDEFTEVVEQTKEAGEELTEAEFLRIAKGEKPHVSHNSGNNEWYTPREYVDAAFEVMGGIDLDPASSPTANEVIDAATFYTTEDDGLGKDWAGRIWMNPPYAGELIGKFASKLCLHFSAGEVSEAIALVNNATETGWFQELAGIASAVCFPKGRVKFRHPERRESAPLQGQAVIYLGGNRAGFIQAFTKFGFVASL